MKEPINYDTLDPQQRLDVARGQPAPSVAGMDDHFRESTEMVAGMDGLADAVRVLLEVPQLQGDQAYSAMPIIERVRAALSAAPVPAVQVDEREACLADGLSGGMSQAEFADKGEKRASMSAPFDARSILGDTGHAEADRLIGRLTSSDPDFEDCTDAAALLRRLVLEEISGPKGHATWRDAAVAERIARAAMRPDEEIVAMARDGMEVYSGPNMNEHKVCAEIVRLDEIFNEASATLTQASPAPSADGGKVESDEVRRLREDAALYREIERAAGSLPAGWEIRLCVELGSGYVQLFDAGGCEVEFATDHERLNCTVADALEAALSAQQGEGERG